MLLAVLGGYWLLPISGQVVVAPGRAADALPWPQIRLTPSAPAAGQSVTVHVTDAVAWPHVLLTVNGAPARLERWWSDPGGSWTWRWGVSRWPAANVGEELTLVFYHDCHTGCTERGRLALGGSPDRQPFAATQARSLPTKLGVVFANPERDWRGRTGWDVELTYARLPDEPRWGVDDLAALVQAASAKGLRVLVRVDYDRGQALPPAGDQLALTEYLQYLRRLARDARLRDVYAYVIGSGFNAADANRLAPQRPVTSQWYARVLNGYGETVTRTDNAVQTIRRENPRARVLVGPVRPWSRDQEGERRHPLDVPWLNYMHTLVAAVDEATRTKAAAGVALTGPDGLALQVAGTPPAAERAGRRGGDEPRLDLGHLTAEGAQPGFRVYQDWLGVVNGTATTRGLPVYITSANTFDRDTGVPPAQNYPAGWLTAALEVVDAEPQIQALCWFVDGPLGDDQWDWFSLSRRSGRLLEAAEEFDALLRAAGERPVPTGSGRPPGMPGGTPAVAGGG